MRSKIILGTAQFGLDYGINNRSGRPDTAVALSLLQEASRNGICMLDTAEAYGNALDIIGGLPDDTRKKFGVITKFTINDSEEDIEKKLDADLERLKADSLYCYQYHRSSDLAREKVLKKILMMKLKGKILNIGVSVYTDSEIEEAIGRDEIDILQLPFNLLDNNTHKGALIAKARQRGKKVHARSVFLQGLFFKPPHEFPVALAGLKESVSRIHNIAKENGISLQSLALHYVNSQKHIDGIVIGVDSIVQLQENLAALDRPCPASIHEQVEKVLVPDKELLNPSTWKV